MANVKLLLTQYTDQYQGPVYTDLALQDDGADFTAFAGDGGTMLLREQPFWRRRLMADGSATYDDLTPSEELHDRLYVMTVIDRAHKVELVFRMPTTTEATTAGFVSPYNVMDLVSWTSSLGDAIQYLAVLGLTGEDSVSYVAEVEYA